MARFALRLTFRDGTTETRGCYASRQLAATAKRRLLNMDGIDFRFDGTTVRVVSYTQEK